MALYSITNNLAPSITVDKAAAQEGDTVKLTNTTSNTRNVSVFLGDDNTGSEMRLGFTAISANSSETFTMPASNICIDNTPTSGGGSND